MSSCPAMPVVLIRWTDWKMMQVFGQLSKKLLITKQSGDLVSRIQHLVDCSDSPKLFINKSAKAFQSLSNRGFDKLPHPRKFLLENGTILEERVVQFSCSKNSHPCTNFPPTTKKINVHCRKNSFKQNIDFYDLSEQASPLPIVDIQLSSGRLNNYCCRNSSNVLQVFGKQCSKGIDPTLVDASRRFSDYFKESLCEFDWQTFSSFCKINNCVFKQSFKTSCESIYLQLSFCNIKKYNC